MTTFIVQVTFPEGGARKRIADTVSVSGSHFARQAEWRFMGGRCTGAVVLAAADAAEAMHAVPPAMRAAASVHAVAI